MSLLLEKLTEPQDFGAKLSVAVEQSTSIFLIILAL